MNPIIEILDKKYHRLNNKSWKRLVDSCDKLDKEMQYLSDQSDDLILAECQKEFNWINGDIANVEVEIESLDENREYYYDAAIALADVIDDLCYSFIIEHDKIDECASWCGENLSNPYSYARTGEGAIFIVLNDEDATAFKLRWQ